MANKNEKSAAKKAAEEKAAQQAAQVETPAEKQEDISLAKIVSMSKNKKGLSNDSKVTLANLVHEAWVKDEDYASVRDGAIAIRDAFMGDVIVTSMIEGHDAFSWIIRKDEKKYLAVKAVLAEQGITLPEFKALPAPTEEQLKLAGNVENPEETRVVTVTAADVTEEAKDKKKKEKALEAANPTKNPAEVKDEKQLAASLSSLLTKSSDNIAVRIKTVINFYRGYLTIQANKAENKEEELKKVKEMSRTEMLEKIAEIVGPCPFALDGHGKIFRNHFVKSGTIISPFCLYRRTAIGADKDAIDDAFLADVVKTVIIWSCNSAIANAQRNIKEAERLIKKNNDIIKKNEDSTDVTLAKTALRYNENQISAANAIIEQMNATITDLKNPSFDGIDTLVEDYNGTDDTKAEYKRAHLIVDNVVKTYYKDVDQTKVDKDAFLKNVQQRAGIIVNMFRDPLSQSIAYNEGNIVELTEKPAEEESKN
jgi:hypothetical protein